MKSVDNITDAINSLEDSAQTLPIETRDEVRGIVEELVYLRLRVSMGEAK